MTLPPASSDPADAAREARIDLAAAHRLAVWHDLTEGIYNHFTVAVPGTPDRFYVPGFGLHWSEVRAADMLTVDCGGRVVAGQGALQRSAYCIHAPIHASHPRHACVLHTHMPYASAFTRLEQPALQPLGQTEALLLDEIAWDDGYDGLAREADEGARLAAALGDRSILFMRNHGVLVTGRSVAEAYDRLYSLERSARVQLHALWTGLPLRTLTPEQVAKAQRQYHGTPLHGAAVAPQRPGSALHFAALRRLLDRREPDYREDAAPPVPADGLRPSPSATLQAA